MNRLGLLRGDRACAAVAADRQECYLHLARWMASRALPVAGRLPGPRGRPAGRGAGFRCATCHLGRCGRARPGEEAFVTVRGFTGGRERSATAPRVGLFGNLGLGNIGNDASVEVMPRYLEADHPDAIVALLASHRTIAPRQYRPV